MGAWSSAPGAGGPRRPPEPSRPHDSASPRPAGPSPRPVGDAATGPVAAAHPGSRRTPARRTSPRPADGPARGAERCAPRRRPAGPAAPLPAPPDPHRAPGRRRRARPSGATRSTWPERGPSGSAAGRRAGCRDDVAAAPVAVPAPRPGPPGPAVPTDRGRAPRPADGLRPVPPIVSTDGPTLVRGTHVAGRSCRNGAMTVSRLIARPMLASIFLVGGVNALRNAPALAAKAKPGHRPLVPLVQKAAPSSRSPGPGDAGAHQRRRPDRRRRALADGRAPRLSAAVLAASLVPTTLAGHRFWEYDRPRRSPAAACTSSRTSRCSAACSSPPATPRGSRASPGAPAGAAKGRAPRGRAPRQDRPARGQARRGQLAEPPSPAASIGSRVTTPPIPGPHRGRTRRSTPSCRCPAASR